MQIFRNREGSLMVGLSFFLLFGAVCGSIFCNGMSDGMKAELQSAEQSMVTAAILRKMDFGQLFFQVLGKRLRALAVVFLVSAVPAAPYLLMGIMACLGFSAAVLICPLTMDAGLLGLWRCLLLVFPQCLIYIPVGYVLLWWMPLTGKRLTVVPVLVLTGGVILGAVVESLINPWIIAFFPGK